MTKTAGIAIDGWKLSIFERHLRAAGYSWDGPHRLLDDTLLLKVNTDDMAALAVVVKAAQAEAVARVTSCN